MKATNLQTMIEQFSSKLPLGIDLNNIGPWMDSLVTDEASLSCGKALRLLTALESKGLAADAELKLLLALRSTLDRIATKQERQFLDIGCPPPDSEMINLQLLVCVYGEMAKRCWHVGEYLNDPSKPESSLQSIASIYVESLEALRRSLLYVAMLYDEPYDDFWRLCYRIYRRSELLGIVDLPTAGTASSACVAQSFKNLLVFYLSDTSFLTQREMKILFNMFSNQPVMVKIYDVLREDKANLLFGLSLQNDQAPIPMAYMQEPLGAEMRYVSTLKVASLAGQYLQGKTGKHDSLDAGNSTLFLKIGKVLGMQNLRKTNRISEKRDCPGLVGFDNIFNFLTQKESTSLAETAYKVQPKHAVGSGGDWSAPELSLVPIGEEAYYSDQAKKTAADGEKMKAFAPKPGQNWKQLLKTDLFDKFQIIDSTAKDYGIFLRTTKKPIKVGEIIGLVNAEDGRVELGLVRKAIRAGQHSIEMNVEVITLKAETAVVWKPGRDKPKKPQPMLLLPGIAALKQADTILYQSHEYRIGEEIYIQQGDNRIRCRIEKLLHTSGGFVHAELAPAV